MSAIALPQDKLIPAWVQPVVALDLLHARGVDLSSALQCTALFVQDLPFAQHQLSASQFDRLVLNGSKLWPGGDFCFQLGHQLAEEGIGPMRQLLNEQTDLTNWVDLVSRFQTLVTPSLVSRVYRVSEREFFLLFNHASQFTVPATSLRTTIALFAHSLKRSAMNPQVEFFLREPEPSDIELFHAHVPAPCHFNAPFAGIRIQVPSIATTEFTPSLRYQLALNQAQALVPPKRYLLSVLVQQLWQFGTGPSSLQSTAQQLQMSPATLKRRLKEVGCSFQLLLDSLRSERAVIELLLSGASVEQVGSRLHFQDTSNFRRAFKRWTGMTPSHLKTAYRDLFGATGS